MQAFLDYALEGLVMVVSLDLDLLAIDALLKSFDGKHDF